MTIDDRIVSDYARICKSTRGITLGSRGPLLFSTPVRAAIVKSNFDALSQQIRNKMRIYEVRPRKDGRGFDLISDQLP